MTYLDEHTQKSLQSKTRLPWHIRILEGFLFWLDPNLTRRKVRYSESVKGPIKARTLTAFKTELWLLSFLGFAIAVLFVSYASSCEYVWVEEDFTDSGVGCVDDCLEPAIQDEADTVTSTERN